MYVYTPWLRADETSCEPGGIVESLYRWNNNEKKTWLYDSYSKQTEDVSQTVNIKIWIRKMLKCTIEYSSAVQ